MAWSNVGGAASSGNSSTASVTHGLTINENDLVVAYVNVNGPETITADDAGWTEAVNEQPSGETAQHAMYWRKAGGSEPSVYSWSLGGSSLWGALVKVYRGSAGPTVDAAAVSSVSGSTSGNLVCDAIDGEVISAGAVSIVMGGRDNRSASGDYTTADNSYTNVMGPSADQETGAADRIYSTGTTFSGSVTLSGPTGSVNDLTYSVHVSFLEEVGASITGDVTVTFDPTATSLTHTRSNAIEGDVTVAVTPAATTMAAQYSMPTSVTTDVIPAASSFTFNEAGVTPNLDGSVTVTFVPEATFGFTEPMALTGSVTVTLTPEAVFGFPETYVLSGGVTVTVTPASGFTFLLEGANIVFFPGFFVTKQNGGYVQSVEETKEALKTAIGGSPSGSINDLWMKFFDSETVPSGSINDRMRYWLKEVKGVSGRGINELLSNWDGVL